MKAGNLVTTKSKHFVGVIIDSRLDGFSTSERGPLHYVYWSSSKVKRNPVWVREADLVRAV